MLVVRRLARARGVQILMLAAVLAYPWAMLGLCVWLGSTAENPPYRCHETIWGCK